MISNFLRDIEWLEICLKQMISKNRKISLANKVSYFMGTPVVSRIFGLHFFSFDLKLNFTFPKLTSAAANFLNKQSVFKPLKCISNEEVLSSTNLHII